MKPYHRQTGPIPKYVTYRLGGQHLVKHTWAKGRDFEGVCDARSGYCITSEDGPDGCEYLLQLAPTFEHYAKVWGSRAEFARLFKGEQVPLKTGNGVCIGDSPTQVEKKLGKPTKQNQFKKYTTYEYNYRGKRLYGARYNFTDNRLVEINFRDARPPGKNNPYGGCP